MGAEGSFDRWLVETQIAPAFRAHSFVRRAEVFVVPRLWLTEPPGSVTEIVVFYGASGAVDLDATLEALAADEQDPNLPTGVSNYDLYAPIAALPGSVHTPPFAFSERSKFRRAQRHPEHGFYEVLDAFAVYASFVRDAHGEALRVRLDARLSTMIDRVMP